MFLILLSLLELLNSFVNFSNLILELYPLVQTEADALLPWQFFAVFGIILSNVDQKLGIPLANSDLTLRTK